MSNNCKVFSTRFPFHPLVEIGVCSRQKLTHTPICSLWDHGLPEESSIWHSYCILNSPPTFHQLLKDSSLYARQKGQINTQQDFIKTNQNFPQKRIFDSLPLLISFLCSQVPKKANVRSSYQCLASQSSNTQTHPGHRWIRMGTHSTGSAGFSRPKVVRVCFSL